MKEDTVQDSQGLKEVKSALVVQQSFLSPNVKLQFPKLNQNQHSSVERKMDTHRQSSRRVCQLRDEIAKSVQRIDQEIRLPGCATVRNTLGPINKLAFDRSEA